MYHMIYLCNGPYHMDPTLKNWKYFQHHRSNQNNSKLPKNTEFRAIRTNLWLREWYWIHSRENSRYG